MKRLDLVGQRFGKLLITQCAGSNGQNTLFLCLCDCGKSVTLIGTEIKRGSHKSCGCSMGKPVTTKAYRDHPLYDVWKGMKARCRDKKHRAYPIYGGAGVKVCELWSKDFFSFYNWCMSMGWKSGLQIDKDIIPKKLGIPAKLYSPEMCSIVTQIENSHNSAQAKLSVEAAADIRSSKLKTKQVAQKYGVSRTTIQRTKSNKLWKVQQPHSSIPVMPEI